MVSGNNALKIGKFIILEETNTDRGKHLNSVWLGFKPGDLSTIPLCHHHVCCCYQFCTRIHQNMCEKSLSFTELSRGFEWCKQGSKKERMKGSRILAAGSDHQHLQVYWFDFGGFAKACGKQLPSSVGRLWLPQLNTERFTLTSHPLSDYQQDKDRECHPISTEIPEAD